MKNGNGKLVQYKDYVAGWLDSSIADFVGHLRDVPSELSFALITSLDSNLRPATLLKKSPELRPLARFAHDIGGAILIQTELLLEANAKSPIFFGFDEIWFFPNDAIEPKPDDTWIVGPSRISQIKLRKLGRWMKNSDCSLGLGDGDGLNLIAKAGGLAKQLIGHSMSQRQHELVGDAE
jgi:hypothetical protein